VLAGCNPAWPEVVSTTYTDNCDAAGSINGIAGDVQTSQDGCTQYRDYTFNFTDSCSNAALQQVTRVSRHYDVTAPVIADKPDVILAGCNTAWPEVVSTTYTDNCDAAGSVNGIAGAVQTSQDGCTQYRDYTFNFTDSCSNAALQQITRVSRHYDVTAPVIVDKPDVVLAGCNPAWPEIVSTTYTDNCDAAGSVNGIAGAVQTSQDGCTQYRDYTFNFTDSCSNAALQQITRVSRHYDMTAPVIVDKPDVILAGCNPAWPEVVSTTYTDNCDAAGSVNGVAGAVQTSQDGCTQYRDYTFNFTDSCSNAALQQITRVSRHYDVTAPVIADKPDYSLSGCNAAWPEAVSTTYTDNCDAAGSINGIAGSVQTSEDGCTQYRDYTFNVTDSCLNGALQQITRVSRHYDITPPQIQCPADLELSACDTPPVLVPPVATDNCDGSVTVVPSRSDGLALNDPFPIGQVVVVTYTAADICGNETSCKFEVLVNACHAAHCTYTQGYYGDLNGSACAPDGTPTYDHQIMINAINAAGGIYKFGSTGTGNYFTLKATDIYGNADPYLNNIWKMLPGGGMPRKLVGFATYDDFSTWSDGDPLTASGNKKGAINNNLLSQTMTLFFNFGVDGTLDDVELEADFATSDVACGSDTPIVGTYQQFHISIDIINYINANPATYPGGATVGNLFKLANRALGGENIGALKYSDINAAVDAINNGFDGCRVQVPYQNQTPPIYTNTQTSLSAPVIDTPTFTAYPIPFRDIITIRYEFDYKTDAKIQIYDSKGALLMTQDDNNVYLNKEVQIHPTFQVGEGQLYYVKVATNKGFTVKKVLSQK
ncbi:HYR domain-containing protein, partial [Flavobacterium sp.]|uniref:HYR domain-containing protein n=1 Tax=Flavobacterium sp. TaxID=239 RepID=UPI00262D12B8